MTFDLIIRHGELVDGTGAPRRTADIAVSGERIALIGDLSGVSAGQEINASGCLVTPGFIDAHAHSDTYLLLEPDASSKLTQGITTEINGQCGGSAAPRLGQARLPSDWASHTYPALDMAGRLSTADRPGANWDTVASYRRLFDAVRPALNTVHFIGHNTLRAGVMGYEPRSATPAEVCEMRRRLEQALAEGGWGLTTGLLYQPGKHAAEEEVIALAGCVATRGGMYATHMRSEGGELLESVEEVLRLARATGVKIHISHLKTAGRGNWHKIEGLIELLESARAAGIEVHADRYPYLASGTDLDVVLPEWASAGGRDAILENLADPSIRARMLSELDAQPRDWESVVIGGGWCDETRSFSGCSVAHCADVLGQSPGGVVCRFIELDQTRTGAFFFGMSPRNLREIYALPWVMACSDASLRAPTGPLGSDHPHPRAYGTMPRFLRMMTRGVDGTPAICGVEEAVRRITSLPAAVFQIRDRGVLRQGAYADITVFNEGELLDLATYTAPHQFSAGIRQVVVNGALSLDQGRFTGHRRGRFLERGV